MSNLDDAVNALSDIAENTDNSSESTTQDNSEPSYPSDVVTPTGQHVRLNEDSTDINTSVSGDIHTKS